MQSRNEVKSYTLGFNKFSDWTDEEFDAILGGKQAMKE